MGPAVAVLLLALMATPTAADPPDPPVVDPPATVERVGETSFPVCLTPTPLVFDADGSYSAHLVFAPIFDPSILPHGQVENSRFDITWEGPLTLRVDPVVDASCVPVFTLVVLAATTPGSGPVTGRAMVHLHRPLPHDPMALEIPGFPPIFVGVPVTPYSINIVLDEPVVALPGLLNLPVRQIQINKGKLVFVK